MLKGAESKQEWDLSQLPVSCRWKLDFLVGNQESAAC